MAKASNVSKRRMRLGLTLWVFSYLPFAAIASGILHSAGFLPTDKSTADFIGTVWVIQIIIGFMGLFLAGKEAIATVRGQGLKKLPRNVWDTLLGRETTQVPQSSDPNHR